MFAPLRHGWSVLVPLGLLLTTLAPAPPGTPPAPEGSLQGVPVEGSTASGPTQHDPREWLPANESLKFKVEVSLGPVRGLDIGKVTLTGVRVPGADGPAMEANAENGASRHLIGTIDSLAKGGYLGHEVIHSIQVRWYVGTQPRIEIEEKLRGSRSTNRVVRIGEIEGKWQVEYGRDRHCKKCKDEAHFVEGFLPWSKPSHCDGCQRLEHRIWRPYEYLGVPEDAIDMVSALYYARGFLLSDQEQIDLPLIQNDTLWMVNLRRGGTREIETPAGTFECMRVLIGPQLAQGEGLDGQHAERFEALFGLHGDISVWVDREGGFPVVIEGSAPFGPFDVAIKASLISHRGN